MSKDETKDAVIDGLKNLIEKIESGKVSVICLSEHVNIVEVHRGNEFREYEQTGIITMSLTYKEAD